jgi:hypothetical protein
MPTINISIELTTAYSNGYTPYLKEISPKLIGQSYEKRLVFAKNIAIAERILCLLNLGCKTGEVYEQIERLIIDEGLNCSLFKNLNYANFRKMVSIWRTKGTLIIAKAGNRNNMNAAIHKEDKELSAWIYYFKTDKRTLSDEHIKRIILWNCELNGKPKPSDRWMGQRLADGHLRAIAAVKVLDRGNRHRQQHDPVLTGLASPMANDRWEMDGTRVNVLAVIVNKKLVFLYVIFVVDDHSGDIIGWSWSTSESPENRFVYAEALKSAVNRTGALPRELVCDRFPGHDTAEFKRIFEKLESKGCKVTFSHRAEGKQRLERLINTFQTVFLSQSDYYYGQGVKASLMASHRSTAYQKEMAKEIKKTNIGLHEMITEVERHINHYRTTKTTEYGRETISKLPYSPQEIWQLADKLNQNSIDSWDIADLFWLSKPLAYRHGKFKMEVNHVPCEYRVEDYEMAKRLETEGEALIRYDADDLKEVYVYSLDSNEFLGSLKRDNIGVTRGVDADGERIGHYIKVNKEFEAKRKAEAMEVLEAMDESKVIGYWGKEATYRQQEMAEADGVLDVYYQNWDN